MAVSNSKISSPTARAKLPVSGKPVYIKLATGISLGYRRNSGDGVWVVRVSDGNGGNRVEKIGLADRGDELPADGDTVLDFPQAQAKALSVKRGAAAARPRKDAVTVGQALDEYEEDRRANGGMLLVFTRLRSILEPIANKRVADLTVGDMKTWRAGVTGTRGKLKQDTIDRLCNSVAAMFRFAALRHDIPPSMAWSSAKGGGLAPPINREDETPRDRNIRLPDGVVRQLVTAAYDYSTAFGLLVELSAVTGCRYSQLAALQVQHLQDNAVIVRQSKKGAPKKRRPPQRIEIAPGLANRLRLAATGRPLTAPLLVRPSGAAWQQSNHIMPFRRIVTAIGQDWRDISLYTLRHSHIMRQLEAGLPVTAVAQWHETSVDEIERHYAVHLSAHVAQHVEDFGPEPASSPKVVRIA